MFGYIMFFVLGLVLIIKGGDWFVDSAIAIAKKTKIPSIVIGATLVSIATTLPELLVSTIATSQGSFELAVGNAVGTMVCNIALILGIVITSMPSETDKKLFSKKIIFLIFVSVLFFAFSINLNIEWWESVCLLLIFALFIWLNLSDARKHGVPAHEKIIEEPFCLWKVVVFFVLGAAGIAIGAMLLVNYGSLIASSLGVSEYIIGLTFVAVGTSLPELVTCFQSIKKKNAGLTIGNIIGANVINGSLLIGISGLVAGTNGLPLTRSTLVFSLPVLFLSTFILALPILFKGRTFRFQGIMLLVVYISYIIAIIAL